VEAIGTVTAAGPRHAEQQRCCCPPGGRLPCEYCRSLAALRDSRAATSSNACARARKAGHKTRANASTAYRSAVDPAGLSPIIRLQGVFGRSGQSSSIELRRFGPSLRLAFCSATLSPRDPRRHPGVTCELSIFLDHLPAFTTHRTPTLLAAGAVSRPPAHPFWRGTSFGAKLLLPGP